MKTLYIMRHPQKNESSSTDDFFLTLTSQGELDAKNVALQLKEENVKIDLMVSSPSLRTEITSLILAKELDLNKNILYNEVLYQGYLDEMVEALNFTFHTINTLFIVGHNPLLSNLANHFVGYKEQIKMSQILKIDFNTSSWVDISYENAKLIQSIKPK